MKESEFGEDDQGFADGDILDTDLYIQSDYVCQLSLVHQDHIYCVTPLPHQPFNTFLSGDGNDKCYIWSIKPRAKEEGDEQDEKQFECV